MATVHYDIRGTGEPTLLCAGSPMDGTGFTTLAGYFGDRRLVTYDRRGVGRSPAEDPSEPLTPERHADDLAAVIDEIGGPVDVFASSGGASNALALVARHPQLVSTLVAHEPPVATALPDREQLLAYMADVHDTYERAGWGPAMAKFVALISRTGPLPATWPDEPVPDPAAFGLPTEDDGSRDDPMIGAGNRPILQFEPDYDALRAAPTRIVIAGGVESQDEMTGRAAAAVAARLGLPLTLFPSHHGGFLGGEFGQTGEPEAFAARLHEVLDGVPAEVRV